MYFCERCNLLMKSDRCGKCGKKKLPLAKDDDFCYFVSLSGNSARLFEVSLQEQNIPVACLGSGIDFRNYCSYDFKIFIPYGFFEQAADLYQTLFGGEEQNESGEVCPQGE